MKRLIWLACLTAAIIAVYTAWLSVIYREGILYLGEPSEVLEYGTWRRVSALLTPVYTAGFAVTAPLGVTGCRLHKGFVPTERQGVLHMLSILLLYGVGLIYSLYVTLRFRGWQLYVGKEPYTAGSLPVDFDACLYPVMAIAACMVLCVLLALAQRAHLTK